VRLNFIELESVEYFSYEKGIGGEGFEGGDGKLEKLGVLRVGR